MTRSSFRDLRVWQKSMELAIPSNVAEGARRSRRPFILRLEIAPGSEAEVEVQLELAHRLVFLAASEYDRCSRAR